MWPFDRKKKAEQAKRKAAEEKKRQIILSNLRSYSSTDFYSQHQIPKIVDDSTTPTLPADISAYERGGFPVHADAFGFIFEKTSHTDSSGISHEVSHSYDSPLPSSNSYQDQSDFSSSSHTNTSSSSSYDSESSSSSYDSGSSSSDSGFSDSGNSSW